MRTCCGDCAGGVGVGCSKTTSSSTVFFEQHGTRLTNPLVRGLLQLMDLSDNDLLDLLLARKEPQDDLDNSEVRQVLLLMRVSQT